MTNYSREEFQKYLMMKVAESTAKTYATDMSVIVKALENIALYKDKDLIEILEDFVSHKKAVKNYLQEEFLVALTKVGSNDSGLYDGIASKAKHYIAMNQISETNERPNYDEQIDQAKNFKDYLELIVGDLVNDAETFQSMVGSALWYSSSYDEVEKIIDSVHVACLNLNDRKSYYKELFGELEKIDTPFERDVYDYLIENFKGSKLKENEIYKILNKIQINLEFDNDEMKTIVSEQTYPGYFSGKN